MDAFKLALVSVLGMAVLIAWRVIERALELRARELDRAEARTDIEKRVRVLEKSLARVPRHVVDVESHDLLEQKLSALEKRLNGAETRLLDRAGAEKIVNTLNAVALDVTALKEWQASIEGPAELRKSLLGEDG